MSDQLPQDRNACVVQRRVVHLNKRLSVDRLIQGHSREEPSSQAVDQRLAFVELLGNDQRKRARRQGRRHRHCQQGTQECDADLAGAQTGRRLGPCAPKAFDELSCRARIHGSEASVLKPFREHNCARRAFWITLRFLVDASAPLEGVESLGGLAPASSLLAQSLTASRARQIAVAMLASALAALTAATLVACAFALIITQQLDEGEPLIYGLASRFLHGEALYQPLDRQPFVQVHYTPLYYALVAILHQWVGHGFAPGRLLSLVAGLVCATLIGSMTAVRARSWWAGGFAVLMFLGMAFPGGPAPFLVLERVDMLGVGLSVAAIALLSRATDTRHLVAAGVLAGLALLTKQSLFAAALAGTIWLATLGRRKAGLFALATALTALIPALTLQWSSAGAFFDNVGPANPSPTALPFGVYLFKELVVIQGVPTLLALFYVVSKRGWKNPWLRLLMLYWLATFLPVAGIIKVGANHNYWIELAAANAVLGTLAIWSSMRVDRRLVWGIASNVPIVLLAVQIGVLAPARFIVDRKEDLVPLSWTLRIDQFMALAGARADFHELSEDLRDEQGVILAEGLDVAVLGDHPIQLEPFAFSMLEYEGRWNSEPLIADICTGRISLLVLTYPIGLDIHPVGLIEFPMWPDSVMTALRSSMKLDSAREGHWLYRPAPSMDAASVSWCEDAAAAARPTIEPR